MENCSRDLLRGIGGGDEDPGRGERKAQRFEPRAEEEVELSLGLSLGGRFGAERRSGQGLARSSSVACIQEAAPDTPELARTNSLPTRADAGNNHSVVGDRTASLRSGAEVQPSATTLQGGGSFPLNSTGASPAAPAVASPRASLSPSQSSSDGEGILTRTSSLPAGIEDLWRKRKVAQALKRIEVKRRIERMNSSNISVEEVADEMNATAKDEKVENCDDLSMKNEQTGGKPKVERMNHNSVRRRLSGLPPPYQPPVASQGTCLQGKLKMQNSALKGTPGAEGRSPSSAVVPSSNGTNGVLQAENGNASAMAPTSSSATAVTAAALGSRGEQQDASERPAARRAREMPLVYTSELPNGRRIEGFLYKYSKADEVRIVCVCHGSFLTPAEFVEHAGGGQVARPMRHIVVNPPSSF